MEFGISVFMNCRIPGASQQVANRISFWGIQFTKGLDVSGGEAERGTACVGSQGDGSVQAYKVRDRASHWDPLPANCIPVVAALILSIPIASH